MIALPSAITSGADGADAARKAAQHRKLTDAAQQFESMFLQEMLRPMNSIGRSDGADDDGGESSQDGTLQSFGTEAVAKAIASAGGLGIARHVVAEVEKQQAGRESAEKNQTTLKM